MDIRRVDTILVVIKEANLEYEEQKQDAKR